jgi:O-antigen ligase
MKTKQTSTLIWPLVVFACVSVSLFITPAISVDPFNLPKMTLLFTIALAIFALVLVNIKTSLTFLNKWLVFTILAFISQLILVVLFSGAPINQQIYGVAGRNTGFLTYLALAIILLGASASASVAKLTSFACAVIFTGIISIAYGLLQVLGRDPINWNNPYSASIGFLGNPNFQSSFAALFASSCVALILKKGLNLILRLMLICAALLSLFVIFQSRSQQGFLVFGFATSLIIFLFVIGNERFQKKHFIIPYAFITGSLGLIVILGTLKIGPLADVLYKLSVRQRGYYWNAALEMMKSHPIFGVGIDSYGDWYFAKRSENAAFISPNAMSNSAHNVYLDFGANGGLLLFVIHGLFFAISLVSVIKYLKRERVFNWAYSALLGVWVGYSAQALISINQIGLAIWGWTSMGILIGVEYKSRSGVESKNNIRRPNKFERQTAKKLGDLSVTSYSGIAGGILIGLLITIPAFNSDANYRKAVGSRSAEGLISAVLKEPRNNTRIIDAAIVLANSNLLDQAKDLTETVLRDNPRFYSAWELKYQLTDKSSVEFMRVLKEMKELNPHVNFSQ